MVAPAVLESLRMVYEVFSVVPKPTRIDACPCCVDNAEICSLLSMPLREITPEQLTGYASSVFLTAGAVEDFRHFLPRILEISIHELTWWPDREIVLARLANADWLTWAAPEVDALNRLFLAAFVAAMSAVESSTPIDIYESASVVDSWICGLALAGADLTPLLLELEKPVRAAILAAYFEDNEKSLAAGTLCNAFWEGHHVATARVVAWFHSATVQEAVLKFRLEHGG